MDLYLIKILAFLNDGHLGSKALRQWSKDLCYYFGDFRFLTQTQFPDYHFIQLSIEWVKWFILANLQFFKPSGKHLKLGILLGAFVGSLQNFSCLLGNWHMRNLVKFIRWDTTKYNIKCFAISISHCESCLIPSGFGSLRPCPTNFYNILHTLINGAQKCTHTHLPKCVITPIKEGRCIEGSGPIHPRGQRSH